MNYKQGMMFPILLLVISIVLLVFQLTTTGLNLDIDLKGGTQITGDFQRSVNEAEIEGLLKQYNANVRTSRSLTGVTSVFIVMDSSIDSQDVIETLANGGYLLDNYSVQTVGASLGEAFFEQAIFVLVFAFLFMAITVFLIFRSPVPSFFVVICGVADLVETLALSQLFGIQLSLATFTSLLLLLGYSVDDNILLTSKVFKSEGDNKTKIRDAMKTGITMMGATIAALLALFMISTSAIIIQIASVLLIGLVVDLLNTWALNAPLIRMYAERKAK
ncbi:MAG: protein translocase subunit SecF [Candidatus Aenigmatarchaeota archaeon]